MILHCDNCTVRSWQPGDENSLPEHANNRAVWLNLRDQFPHPYAPDDARQWITSVVGRHPETNWTIDVAGEAVGGIGVRLHNDIERGTAEIGYWLGEAHWGRGITTTALRTVTAYAFGQFDLLRIYAVPFVRNAASVRVLEKAGYQYEGTMRYSAIKDGIVQDQHLYARIRENRAISPLY